MSEPGDIETRDPEDLRPHPYNARLYRQRVPSRRFIEDIAEQMEEPLVVNEDGEIIDGVRRWLAALEEGMDSVGVIEEPNRTDEEEQEAILRHNDDRDETFSQKMRVALEYEEMIAPLLAERMKAGKSLDEQEDDPLLKSKEGENVTANELAANRVGWKETKYWEAKTVWEAKESGDETARKLVNHLDDPNPDPEDDISVHGANQKLQDERGKDSTGDDEPPESRGIVGGDQVRDEIEERTKYPVQASFQVNVNRLGQVLTQVRLPNTLTETENQSVGLGVRDEKVDIWTVGSDGIHSCYTLSEEFLDDLSLERDGPVIIWLVLRDIRTYLDILSGGTIEVQLRGPDESPFAVSFNAISGGLHIRLKAIIGLDGHPEPPRWIPQEYSDEVPEEPDPELFQEVSPAGDEDESTDRAEGDDDSSNDEPDDSGDWGW